MLGSLLMFALLALAMVTTRRLDWYGLAQTNANNIATL
jgi:inner membrane protein